MNNLGRWRRQAERILGLRASLTSVSDEALRTRTQQLRWQAQAGVNLSRLLPDAFALGVEASFRALGLVHYPVQVMGGLALFEGHVAEMQTGEGKTLTAVLPVVLRALTGRGVHVVTANDYLARRDAEQMGQAFAQLGLTTGCIQQPQSDDERRAAYACDVTYGTASEMGFDYLRDCLKRGASAEAAAFNSRPIPGAVQRGHHCAIVDEADNLLIDDARTPLIIGVMEDSSAAELNLYRWCSEAAAQLAPGRDYLFEPRKRTVHLTESGCRRVVLLSKPVLLDSLDTERIYQHLERALTAQLAFARDRDYVVHKGEIIIVDEGTGRTMDGRKWEEGLHQAVEAKERVDSTGRTTSAARITLQSFYRLYEHLAGMTGTATPARREFWKTYRLRVTRIPTHRPCRRTGSRPRVFTTQQAKSVAISEQIARLVSAGRAVLVGTPSVHASEQLAARLEEQGVEYVILNARHHAREAEIVAAAGQPGRVTIATNMAGRGTDIHLDDAVRRAGGLHVIATELHSSARIDRQLIGRAARQGDPGSYQFFLSWEDELLRVLPEKRRSRILERARAGGDRELSGRLARLFVRTQRMLEQLHRKQRATMLKQERKRRKRTRRVGWDPDLELAED